jgi:hypothetical protein
MPHAPRPSLPPTTRSFFSASTLALGARAWAGKMRGARRAAGGRAKYQPIAANVDVAHIVQSCDADFSLNRLDR